MLANWIAAFPDGSPSAVGPPNAAMASGGNQPFINWMQFTKPGRVKPPAPIPAVKSCAVGPNEYRPSTPPDKDWLATFAPFTYLDSCWPAGAVRSIANATRYHVSGDSVPLNCPSTPRPFGSGSALRPPT